VATLNKGKCGFDNLLQSLAAVGNFEQNSFYPPSIFEAHVNTITSLLISELARAYPKNPQIVDILDPFIEVETIPATNGYVQLPEKYRDILGTPMVFLNKKSTGECSGAEQITPQNFKAGILKSGCSLTEVTIVPQSEFSALTRSTYNFPTYERPIGYFSGKKQIRICPYDLTKVSVMYVRQEKSYVFGYITNPDDTFFIDPDTTIDTEWTNAAYTPIYNALVTLYGVYSRDGDITNWANVLKGGIL